MIGQGVRALLYLQVRTGINWLKRSTRSAIVWLLVIGATGSFLAGLLAEGSELPSSVPADEPVVPDDYFQAGVLVLFIVVALLGLWRGTGKPPRATLADVVFVLGSPLSSRLKFAFLMAREIGGTLLLIVVFAAASLFSTLIVAAGTGDIGARFVNNRLTLVMLVILLAGEFVRMLTWIATEQVVARDAVRGFWIRRGLRLGTAAVGMVLLALLVVPVARENYADWRAVADAVVDRVLGLSWLPPLSWAIDAFSDTGSLIVPVAGLIALVTTLGVASLWLARDFTESIAVTAERQTDARGQATESGADLQWAAMSQLGTSRRIGITLPPFGSGSWALLWSSLTRWIRYQVSVAWISGVALIVIGGGGALLVRLDIVSHYWAWGLILTTPLFGSYYIFLDELRRPFIFLTPGPAWSRLVASGATSILDGFSSSLVTATVIAATGARPVGEAFGLAAGALGIGIVTQSAVSLVQIVLPSWLGRRIRTGLTFTASTVAAIPPAIAFFSGLLTSGLAAGLIAGIGVSLVWGLILLALCVWFFDRLEMPG